MNRITQTLAVLGLLGATFVFAGCKSDEENPVTPDKMEEIRKKQDAERGNFNPSGGGAPGASAPAPSGQGR